MHPGSESKPKIITISPANSIFKLDFEKVKIFAKSETDCLVKFIDSNPSSFLKNSFYKKNFCFARNINHVVLWFISYDWFSSVSIFENTKVKLT